MSSYRELVETLARQRNGKAFYNESLDHAAIIAETMFGYARDHVSILTGKLDARVYGPEAVIDKARLFLIDQGHKLKVLVEDEKDALKEHPFLQALRDQSGETWPNVRLRSVPPDVRSTFDFHFMVMDGDSYRFERDKTKEAAVAAFGDKDGAANLEKVFRTLWDACGEGSAQSK